MAKTGRPEAASVVENAFAVMRYINKIAPAQPGLPGPLVHINRIARETGMPAPKVEEAIRQLNEWGASLSDRDTGLAAYFVLYDEQTKLVTPYHMDAAMDRTVGLTPAQTRALLTLFNIAGVDQDDPLYQKVSDAIPPLTAQKVKGIRAQVGQAHLSENLAFLSQAIERHHVLHILYRGMRDSKACDRFVEPTRLAFDQQNWYLACWCRDACGWRMFRLDRIEAMDKTGERFDPRLSGKGTGETATTPSQSLAEARQRAILLVHDPIAVLEGDPWPGLERLTNPSPEHAALLVEEDRVRGGYLASIPLMANSPWLARQVAASLGLVEVVSPRELADQVRRLAGQLLALLDEAGEERG